MPEANPSAAQVTPEAAAGAPVTPPANPAVKAPEAAPAAAPAAQAKAPEAQATEPAKVSPEAKPEPEAKPTEAEKPVVPEKYDLKLPKDSALSDAHVAKLSTYAKEKGLSNEQAQSLLERENSAVSDYVSQVTEKQNEIKNSWYETAKSDKEIGGEAFKQNSELAQRVVSRFGTDDFKKELNKTGLGNHPELLRVFSRIGKAMAEDQLIIPGGKVGSKKSTADVLYGGGETKEN